jgi:hypothetical protein
MLYPFETGRAHIYKDRGNFYKAPLLMDILDFYCSALFKQLDSSIRENNYISIKQGQKVVIHFDKYYKLYFPCHFSINPFPTPSSNTIASSGTPGSFLALTI